MDSAALDVEAYCTVTQACTRRSREGATSVCNLICTYHVHTLAVLASADNFMNAFRCFYSYIAMRKKNKKRRTRSRETV